MPRRKPQWKPADAWDYKLKPLRSQATGNYKPSIDPGMPDYPKSEFVLFSNLNKSKDEKSADDYWARAEWPIDQIAALHEWAVTKAVQVQNQKGDTCVEVAMKLLPRTSKAGNDYYLAVVSDPRTKQEEQAAAEDPNAPF